MDGIQSSCVSRKPEGYMRSLSEDQLRESCRLVENVARSLGKDCQIIFTDDRVSVAPVSWAGDSTGKTLYDALCDARKSNNGDL